MVAAIFVVAIVVGLVLAFVRLTNAKVWTGTTSRENAKTPATRRPRGSRRVMATRTSRRDRRATKPLGASADRRDWLFGAECFARADAARGGRGRRGEEVGGEEGRGDGEEYGGGRDDGR